MKNVGIFQSTNNETRLERLKLKKLIRTLFWEYGYIFYLIIVFWKTLTHGGGQGINIEKIDIHSIIVILRLGMLSINFSTKL